ncbi:helix-turn-helix domain-containing protein [Deinococcus aquaedulcis]|uniref:helix-turn-helix domain-containing protein n=1 Tax=Deinococcus aquaedulcis TaxID=2840455 RepID=UPI001C836237|nr:helix-turn-helix domain-containing protein [Deinococcus aquaedulcis]
MTGMAAGGLQMEEGLWRTFTSLLDGPSTARAVATRLGRPVATIVRNLNHLQEHGLVCETGTDRVGHHIERVYRLPEGAVRVRDERALGLAFHETERGLTLAAYNGLPSAAGMVSVCVPRERAAGIMDRLQALREEIEGLQQEGGDVKLSFFLAGWTED